MGLFVDVMIKKEFRSLKHFVMMSITLNEICKAENISFLFAYPNDNSYPIFKKVLEYKDIGRLNFFVLPVNIGKLKKELSFLSPLTKLYSSFICSKFLSYFTKDVYEKKDIKKVFDLSFIKQRYSSSHKIIEINDFKFFYKIEDFENTKVAYLIDVQPLSKKNIESSVNYIYKKHKKEIDTIMYIGNISYSPINLIKVPLKYEPKNINFIGLTLEENVFDDKIFDLQKWESNLSDFDVI